jgi:presenilin-like A22 family membrane protease
MLHTGSNNQRQVRVNGLTEKETAKFKVRPVYLLPILASLIFGLFCAYVLKAGQTEVIPVAPIPETTPGAPFGNASYFVILIAISATLFYLLIKRGSMKIIKYMIALAMTTASFFLSLVYLYAIFSSFANVNLIVLPLSIAITVLFDLAIFKYPGKPRNLAVILLGGALGVFFGASIPLYSAILILVFLAVYDVIAVYRGPVGKIAQNGLDQLSGLSYSFRDIQMGLGDLVFYSMLSGSMIFSFPTTILPCLISNVGIIIGSVLTFFMLQKKGMFPGLPFPIMLGLAGGLIVGFLL